MCRIDIALFSLCRDLQAIGLNPIDDPRILKRLLSNLQAAPALLVSPPAAETPSEKAIASSNASRLKDQSGVIDLIKRIDSYVVGTLPLSEDDQKRVQSLLDKRVIGLLLALLGRLVHLFVQDSNPADEKSHGAVAAACSTGAAGSSSAVGHEVRTDHLRQKVVTSAVALLRKLMLADAARSVFLSAPNRFVLLDLMFLHPAIEAQAHTSRVFKLKPKLEVSDFTMVELLMAASRMSWKGGDASAVFGAYPRLEELAANLVALVALGRHTLPADRTSEHPSEC